MAKEIKKNAEDKKTIGQVVSAFFVKFRLFILGFVAALIVASIVLGIAVSLINSSRKADFAKIEDYVSKLSDVRDKQGADVASVQNEILTDLVPFAKKNMNNPVGIRANMLLAEIYFDRSEWEPARSAWVNAADANKKVYTAPLSYYNAGICSEELGDYDAAVEYFTKAAASVSFSMKTHAMFNIGRIEDQRGDYSKAVAQYEKLITDFPTDHWANLAKTRVLALQAEGKVN